jgi:WD40 repeat protein
MATSASPDGTVRLWDATTGAWKHTLKAGGFTKSLSFSDDGRYLKTDYGFLNLNSGPPDTFIHRG